ncbi:MAG: SUMF1/EgtB/PvdO family nonheme iron enzyme [Kiritimatiellaeota bacterium]|nr:SUMF1/EgtB/PvdO family nonheme iron enzyme [Kiritimatiellota bacterium]
MAANCLSFVLVAVARMINRPTGLGACAIHMAALLALPAGLAAAGEPRPNPDFPATEVRFGWLRQEHLHPDQPSPRPRPLHDKLIRNNFASLRLAIEDLSKTFGNQYAKGGEYLKRLAAIEQAVLETQAPLAPLAAAFDQLHKEALVANPLLAFGSLLFIDRAGGPLNPEAWLSIARTRPAGIDNAVKVLAPVSPDGKVTTLFTPPGKAAIARMDLHFDGNKLLYSSNARKPRSNDGNWQIREVDLPPQLDPATGQPEVREIETIPDVDVENYDSCYGPDGSIYFMSTAAMLGVPCIGGAAPIGSLYRKKPDGTVERLTVDQDHNWHPSLRPDGRIMYLRWDYTDTPHCFNRIVFSMNPDGTDQAAMYGSGSYWPNSTFYPRAIPGSTTKFVGIVSGHHDIGHMGHLILFDTTKSRFETDGVVQQIPGWGKTVKPVISDGLVGGLLPLFVTPYPLSDKYFLAGVQTQPDAGTELYLVDVFDNALKLYGAPGRSMIEPLPLRKRPKPPVIPARTIADAQTATVVMSDVYVGDGLKDVPHGKAKSLRIFSYNFAMRGMGGTPHRVGIDGPWDVRVILGTVPVETDGSAHFTVPARLPIAVQPLDEEGKALQYMRSWFTCQPGEVRSCVGCHESANTAPPSQAAKAALRKPSNITPFYGPMRGFSFNREVQPVLDKYCVGCHHGGTQLAGRDGRKIADLTLRPDEAIVLKNGIKDPPAHFPPAYLQLQRFVRNATLEGDLHMLAPYDLHVDQVRLVQLLKKGHHGVKLDAEGWDRLITWMDLNIPAHGSWKDIVGTNTVEAVQARRKDLMQRYARVSFDPEDVAPFAVDAARPKITPIIPAKPPQRPASIRPTHPLQIDPAGLTEATDPKTGKLRELIVPLTAELKLRLVRIPAGTFVLGDAAGYEDEWNERLVKIEKPFWMGVCEVSNREYALFDPHHDSRLERSEFWHFDGGARGSPVNEPLQPVVRISQIQAAAFCRWLTEKTGRRFALPSEEQWEWAARFGKCDPDGWAGKDFSKLANLADKTYYVRGDPLVPFRRIAVENVDDGYRVSAPVGRFAPNEAGLYDMTGNVAEWTTSQWKPAEKNDLHVVARGGSWQDIPYRARPASRVPYRPEMKVVDVGFRVIAE